MLQLDEARALIASRIHALPPERVPLAGARGRALRESVAAPEDMPAFHRSAFDGYALRAVDVPDRLRVVGEVAAGAVPARPIERGECVRIFTGGQVPDGADAVAMQEHCTRDGDWVEIAATETGHGVRHRGEDARAGDVLLGRGQALGPLEISLLAQLGHTGPLVAPRVRTWHVVTGSELVAPETVPGAGQIRDSNSTLVAALAEASGCELVGQGRAGDDLESTMSAIGRVDGWEMLLISGGASVGEYDFGRAALEEMGFSVHFHALNLRPGKPLIFATRGRQFAFVLPGNPLSHFVCWHVAVRAAIEVATQGEVAWNLVSMSLGGNQRLAAHPRETWWPARWEIQAGGAVAIPLRWQSSGDLTRLAGANGLIRVPSGKGELQPGAKVQVLSV